MNNSPAAILIDSDHHAPYLPPLEVQVVRSKRRTKTAQARLTGNVLEVRIPARLNQTEEDEMVSHFVDKFERSRTASNIDLDQRAVHLADQFDLPHPTSIRWVNNQQHRWGSCTPADGTIRISNRLAGFPSWVLDYVIVHELTHLVIDGHGQNFWELVNRYPLTERARGYLMAKGHDGG